MKGKNGPNGYIDALMRALFALVVVAILFSPQQRGYSPIEDGEAHGDPPYLLEDGWESLLNGTDLTGWKACDPQAKNDWYTAKAVRFERYLGPTQLQGRQGAGGTMLNGPTGRTANLCTDKSFGDVELYLEFMLAKGSNSGVYLQGLYRSSDLRQLGINRADDDLRWGRRLPPMGRRTWRGRLGTARQCRKTSR